MSRSDRSTSAWSPRPPHSRTSRRRRSNPERSRSSPRRRPAPRGPRSPPLRGLSRTPASRGRGRAGTQGVRRPAGATDVLAVGRAHHRSRLWNRDDRHWHAVRLDELDIDGDRGLRSVRDQDPQRPGSVTPVSCRGRAPVTLPSSSTPKRIDPPAPFERQTTASTSSPSESGRLSSPLNSTRKVSPASTSERSSSSVTGLDTVRGVGEELRRSRSYGDRRGGRPLPHRTASLESLMGTAPVGQRPDRPAPSSNWLRRSLWHR